MMLVGAKGGRKGKHMYQPLLDDLQAGFEICWLVQLLLVANGFLGSDEREAE